MKSKFSLSWGDSACVREVFLKYCNLIHHVNQTNSGYRFGKNCKNLEDKTRILSKELLGINHKYIVITNGAMQGLDASLSYYKSLDFWDVLTRDFCFPYYPKIIAKNKLFQILLDDIGSPTLKTIELNDSPSNPEARIGNVSDCPEKVIWDAVYNNPVYKYIITPPIYHNLAIGSFGKLFGLPGLRVGWVATNDKKIADYVRKHVEITTCGVSSASQLIIEKILEKPSWLPMFFKEAKAAIDANKTEFLKVKHLFEGQIPGDDGMFFFPEVNSKALKVLSKTGIEFTPGEACGDVSGSHIRLNMAQTNEISRQAVKAILKADRI